MPFARAWRVDLRPYRGERRERSGLGKVRCDHRGYVYVVDAEGAVYKFDGNGELVSRLPDAIALGCLTQPRDVAIDPTGNVFVADLGGEASPSKIVHFDSLGRLIRSFPVEGFVEALAIDSAGFLYLHMVTSPWRIRKVTPGGEHVTSFGRRPKERRPAVREAVQRMPGPRLYEIMSAVAVDRLDRVYFAPSWKYDIPQFTAEGKVGRRFKQRRTHAGPHSGSVFGEVSSAITILDISIPPGKDQLYVRRTGKPSRAGGALVDLWPMDGGTPTEIHLDDKAHSIACDDSGSLYLLYSEEAFGQARLTKYVQVP